jgi:hypothetical protein
MARTPVTFSITHFFKSFCARTGNKHKLTNRQHKKILETAGQVMKEIILQEGDLKLFSRMGELGIRKMKPAGEKGPIDFAAHSMGINAVHFNDHSDGYIGRVRWARGNCVLNDKHMWLFRPVRKFKRELAAIMKSGKNNYLIHTK